MEEPVHGSILKQQGASTSLPPSHLQSGIPSQSLPVPIQADVTAMETKTNKMTFIIIPLFFCVVAV